MLDFSFSYVSGPKTCVSCAEIDTDYFGNEVVPKISNVNSAEECRDLCLATTGCHVMMYAGMWRECFLKTVDALTDQRTLAGGIAALMTC